MDVRARSGGMHHSLVKLKHEPLEATWSLLNLLPSAVVH